MTIKQSHGGSGKQARAVIDGLPADVVTLALAYDMDARIASKLIPAIGNRACHNSAPYTSTIVLLVRAGNPKGIGLGRSGGRRRGDYAESETSGGARWNYLAAWGYALKKWQRPRRREDFVAALYRNVPVLDSGARGATTAFVQRGMGDVLMRGRTKRLARKNPAWTRLSRPPSSTIWPSRRWRSWTRCRKRGTGVAQAYLEFLYTPEGQEIAARHFYRPRLEAVRAKYAARFPNVDRIHDRRVFWRLGQAQKTHFDDGGVFDQICVPGS